MNAVKSGQSKVGARLTSAVAAAMCFSFASPALASPGDGIRLGPVKVEPHLGLNFSYDSNPWLLNDTERSALVASTSDTFPFSLAAFGVNPGVAAGLSYERVEAKFSYDQFLRTYLAEQSYRRALSFYDNFSTKLFVDVLPKQQFGVTFRGVVRNQSSTNQSASFDIESAIIDGIEPSALNIGGGLNDRLVNDMGLKFRYSPGAALDFYLGGSWLYERYVGDLYADAAQNTSPDSFEVFGLKNSYGVDLSGRWKFFPRTYLQAETNFATVNYQLPAERQLGTWTARAGLVGQFTSSIQAVALIGYGQLNNAPETSDDLRGLSGVIGQASLNWAPQKTQALNLSYVRNFADNIIADYYINNTVSLGYNGAFYDRLETNASVGLDFRTLDLVSGIEAGSAETREDQRYRFRASVAYRVADWLRATAGYQLTLLDSSQNSIDYTRHMLTLGVRGSY